jgi:hypothetical protein
MILYQSAKEINIRVTKIKINTSVLIKIISTVINNQMLA